MGPIGTNLSKALHPLGDKAIISHIIESFPKNSEFVIGVGFLGKQVKNYLKMAHEKTKFTFVDVKNYDGIGSGPGHSLSCCKKYLQKPFYFVSCDTLWDNKINFKIKSNWLGVSRVKNNETKNYCNVKLENNRITDVLDKKFTSDRKYKAFVGLCFIKDYKIFWKGIKSKILINGENQISNGIKYLIENSNTMGLKINWTDIGDKDKYEHAVKKYARYDFSKTNEALYILNKKVIKFFIDPQIVRLRYKKSKMNKKVFPIIDHLSEQFYSYRFQSGKTLYENNNEKIFSSLLTWLSKNLWEKDKNINKNINQACLDFYKNKTLKRIELFHKKYKKNNRSLLINNKIIPPTSKLIKQVDWKSLSNGIPAFIHGDLQFDNILHDSNKNSFTLLDWRQDFAGNVNIGDIYYDLAKLYGGILINYDYIKLNLFNYSEKHDEIKYDFTIRKKMENYKKIFQVFIKKNSYDFKKICILTSLIYLNMSPLHKYPFDKLLYSHGKSMLHSEVNNINN